MPEPWLYAAPRRFYRARKPKELRAARAESRAELAHRRAKVSK